MGAAFEILLAQPGMVEEIRRVDVAAWGEEGAATAEMIASRIEVYPFGNFVAIDRAKNEIVGSVFTVAADDKPVQTWLESTGDGCYSRVFNPHGEVIFGANLAVVPDQRGAKVGMLLLKRAVDTVWILGKRFGRLGARMPRFCDWQKLFSPSDYIRLYRSNDQLFFCDEQGVFHATDFRPVDRQRIESGQEKIDPREWRISPHSPLRDLRPLDGELAYFCSCVVRERPFEIMKLLPDYFPPDPESDGHGVLLEWRNPDFD